MKARWFLPLAAFLGLAVLLGVGLKLNPREVPSPFIGKPAPPLALPSLADAATPVRAADLQGRVWLLNVWASWCAPCRDEHPLLVEIARREGVAIVGLNYKDDPAAATRWLQALGNPYTAVARDADGRAGIDWGVYGVPETFVIDRDGIVRWKHVGALTPQVWERDFRPLIAKLSR